MDRSVTLLCIFLCLTHIKGLTEEDLKQARASCIEKTGVSTDLIDDINKEGKFSDDGNLKCYIKCVHEYLGLMANDGTMDYETIIRNVPKEFQIKYASRIRACGTICKKIKKKLKMVTGIQ